MKHCPLCTTGKLMVSGSHEFCDTCGFIGFVLNEDYLHACSVVLGTLNSNTRFGSDDGFKNAIVNQINTHLPMLANYTNRIINGRENFLDRMVDMAKSQAVNLQVNQAVVNEEPEEPSLKCACGCTDFDRNGDKVDELICRQCYSKFVYNTDTGLFEPWFICDCSCNEVTFYQNDTTGLCECAQCSTQYIYNSKSDMFYRVGGKS